MRPLIIYTSYYPYSKMSESFLADELVISVGEGYSVTIVPVNKDKESRTLVEGVNLDNCICKTGILKKIGSLFRIVSFLKYTSFRRIVEVTRNGYLTNALKYLYAAGLVYGDLVKRANDCDNCVFYSYWLSYAPIAFALYKYKHPKTTHKYIARGHGSDIYSTEVGVYYPLREFTFKHIDGVFPISLYGDNYLKGKYPCLIGKTNLARLGVKDNYIEKTLDEQAFRIVSCSSVIPLKRVSLIYRTISAYALIHPDRSFEWEHFGDGPLMEELKSIINTEEGIVSNLKVTLRGIISNSIILKCYRDNIYGCFVLLSTSEGIPVSIMEAISSGIPVIANDVGGVREIVNDRTGVLINKDFTQLDFNYALDYIIANKTQLSRSAYLFYKENYNACHNYKKFLNEIENLK